jgi:hypothetical protein
MKFKELKVYRFELLGRSIRFKVGRRNIKKPRLFPVFSVDKGAIFALNWSWLIWLGWVTVVKKNRRKNNA